MINNERRKEIRRKAEAIRTLLDLDTFPLDFNAILEYEKIELFEANLDDLIPGKKISGILNIQDSVRKIYINRNHADTRNLFTVGRELGHYYLHREQLENNQGQLISFRGNGYNEIEEEADLFSAELIMPKSVILKLAREEGMNSSKQLANFFKVSQIAMNKRIDEINKEISEGLIDE